MPHAIVPVPVPRRVTSPTKLLALIVDKLGGAMARYGYQFGLATKVLTLTEPTMPMCTACTGSD